MDDQKDDKQKGFSLMGNDLGFLKARFFVTQTHIFGATFVPFGLAMDSISNFPPWTAGCFKASDQGISLSQVAAVLWPAILVFAATLEVCHLFPTTGGDSPSKYVPPRTTKGPGSTEHEGWGFVKDEIPKLEIILLMAEILHQLIGSFSHYY